MRFARVFFVALVSGFAGTAWAAGNLPVQQIHLDRKAANYEIEILYPKTGHAAIDARVEAWAKERADRFAADAADKQPGESPYTLNASFTVVRNDAEMFETLFEADSYTGGAHPNHELVTLNFLLPDGAQVYFPEVFTTAGIARISDLATKNLIAELVKSTDAITSEDDVRRGASADADNFSAFSITKTGLLLYFQEYQVAAYAAGPQQTIIPLAKVRGYMRDDWRAPAPSFDCEKAITPIEKAICASVALARLDRQVAVAYAWKLRLAANTDEQNRVKEQQRQFLSTRDNTCTSETGEAMTQCLATAYRARAKALDAVQP